MNTDRIRNSHIAIIHVAKAQLGLSDEEYRAVLHIAAGIESSRDIQSPEQFQSIMDAFERLGFQSQPQHNTSDREYQRRTAVGGGKDPVDRVRHTHTPWRCYTRQRRKIEAMWYERARTKTHAALSAFCRRTTGCDPEFMDHIQASAVIVALEKL